MALQVGLEKDKARFQQTTRVRDSAHPRLEGAFTYSIHDGGIALVGIAVRPRAGVKRDERRPLTVTDVRDLPIARWEQAARSHAVEAINARWQGDVARRLARSTYEEAVALVEPDLVEAFRARPGDGQLVRRYDAAVQLAKVAGLYRQLVREGVRNPATEIARVFGGVSDATARAWVYRARSKGYLGRATGTTVGEGLELRAKEKPKRRRGKR